MRFFYDQYAPRRRGELLLLLADSLTLVAAILFASGAAYRPGRGLDALLVIVWASIPRATGRWFEALQRPRDFGGSFLLASGFVAFCGVVIMAGIDLLWESSPVEERMLPVTLLTILLAWGSGFLLFAPRWYRLHDGLVAGVMLMGLVERMPQPLLWVPLFLFGLCLSAAVRHQLLDVFRGSAKPPLHLQNAWAATAIAAPVAFASFVAVFLGFYMILGEPSEGSPEGSPLRSFMSRAVSVPIYRGQESDSVRHGAESEARPPTGEAVEGTRIRPFVPDPQPTRRVRLSDVVERQQDPRVVFVAEVLLEEGQRPWRPHRLTLWKERTLDVFDPVSSTWREGSPPEPHYWPDSHLLVRDSNQASYRLAIEVQTPGICDTLVTPYFVTEQGPILRTPADTVYLENDFGDVYPYPPLGRQTLYFTRFFPITVSAPELLRDEPVAAHSDPATRWIPAPVDMGIDFEQEAAAIFGDPTTLGRALGQLRDYYREEFLYSNDVAWRGQGRPLATFLNEKIGNCLYFATSAALLLRAHGVSTRLATGFLGGQWQEENELIVVRNRTSHAWMEIYAPDLGWLPVDPTSWVDLHPDYQPPPELALAPPPSATPRNRRDQPRGDPTGEPGRNGSSAPDRARKPRGERPSPVIPTERDAGTTSERKPAIFTRENRNSARDRLARWQQDEARLRTLSLPRPGEEETARTGSTPHPTVDGPANSGDPAESQLHPPPLRGPLSRLALLLLGGLVSFLALRSILRPKKHDPDDSEGEEVEEEAPLEPLGGPRIAGPEFVASDAREEILLEYHRLQMELSRTRSHRRSHETPHEHARRFQGRAPALDRALAMVAEIVVDSLFGVRVPQNDDITGVRRAARIVRKHLG